MPLFTVLSGYLYAFRPVSRIQHLPLLVRSKARRLLIPLLVVGTLLFWTKLVTPGTNSKPALGDWWRPYVTGMDHLWFLQAIFVVFLVVALLDLTPALSTLRAWVVTTTAIGVLFVVFPSGWGVFSVSGALRLLPFFLIGYAFRRFNLGSATRKWFGTMTTVFVALYIPRTLSAYGVFEVPLAAERALALIVGAAAVCLLFWFRVELTNPVLAWIGQYAFGIYLLHYFTASAARIALRALDMDANVTVFVGGLAAGIGGPILFQLATKRVPLFRFLVLGEKFRKTIPWKATNTFEPAHKGQQSQ